MSNLVCKDCKSTDVTEYPPGIFGESRHRCKSCGNISSTENFVELTLFDRITASPEVLAEWSVYVHENCRIPDGATSPFIDNIFWFDDEKGNTWDERFDNAWGKALAATVAKLKEVVK